MENEGEMEGDEMLRDYSFSILLLISRLEK